MKNFLHKNEITSKNSNSDIDNMDQLKDKDENDNLSRDKLHRRNLYYSAITANMLAMSIGSVTVWPSLVLMKLKEEGLTSNEETWVVSLSTLGSCLGPTLYTLTIDRLGRKITMLIGNTIFLISWAILIIGGTNIYALCIARLIAGLANGITYSIAAIYISEISDVDMRQTLSSLGFPFIAVQMMILYAVGPYLSYNLIILVSALPAILFSAGWFYLRESPYHLVAKDRNNQATEALIWLRGSTDVDHELQQIKAMVETLKNQTVNKLDLFLKRGPRKAFLLSSLMFLLQPFSDSNIIGSYMKEILANTSISVSNDMAALIISAANVLFSLGEPFIVHKFGSKWTMVISSFLSVLSLFCFGMYKYFDERNYRMSSLTWIPIVCIISYGLFFGGYGTLPWSISAELFPPELKGFGTNVVITMHCIMSFLVTSLYGILKPVIGEAWFFISTTLIFMAGDLLIAIVLPNTADMSLDRIQDVLGGIKN